MRALAVILVVLYHMNNPWVQGLKLTWNAEVLIFIRRFYWRRYILRHIRLLSYRRAAPRFCRAQPRFLGISSSFGVPHWFTVIYGRLLISQNQATFISKLFVFGIHTSRSSFNSANGNVASFAFGTFIVPSFLIIEGYWSRRSSCRQFLVLHGNHELFFVRYTTQLSATLLVAFSRGTVLFHVPHNVYSVHPRGEEDLQAESIRAFCHDISGASQRGLVNSYIYYPYRRFVRQLSQSTSTAKFFITPCRFWEFLIGALVCMHEKKLPAEKIPWMVPMIIAISLVIAGCLIPNS